MSRKYEIRRVTRPETTRGHLLPKQRQVLGLIIEGKPEEARAIFKANRTWAWDDEMLLLQRIVMHEEGYSLPRESWAKFVQMVREDLIYTLRSPGMKAWDKEN